MILTVGKLFCMRLRSQGGRRRERNERQRRQRGSQHRLISPRTPREASTLTHLMSTMSRVTHTGRLYCANE